MSPTTGEPLTIGTGYIEPTSAPQVHDAGLRIDKECQRQGLLVAQLPQSSVIDLDLSAMACIAVISVDHFPLSFTSSVPFRDALIFDEVLFAFR